MRIINYDYVPAFVSSTLTLAKSNLPQSRTLLVISALAFAVLLVKATLGLAKKLSGRVSAAANNLAAPPALPVILPAPPSIPSIKVTFHPTFLSPQEQEKLKAINPAGYLTLGTLSALTSDHLFYIASFMKNGDLLTLRRTSKGLCAIADARFRSQGAKIIEHIVNAETQKALGALTRFHVGNKRTVSPSTLDLHPLDIPEVTARNFITCFNFAKTIENPGVKIEFLLNLSKTSFTNLKSNFLVKNILVLNLFDDFEGFRLGLLKIVSELGYGRILYREELRKLPQIETQSLIEFIEKYILLLRPYSSYVVTNCLIAACEKWDIVRPLPLELVCEKEAPEGAGAFEELVSLCFRENPYVAHLLREDKVCYPEQEILSSNNQIEFTQLNLTLDEMDPSPAITFINLLRLLENVKNEKERRALSLRELTEVVMNLRIFFRLNILEFKMLRNKDDQYLEGWSSIFQEAEEQIKAHQRACLLTVCGKRKENS